MKISAVAVCVDYSDCLALTLPHNKSLFDEFVVITSTADKETQEVCWRNGVTCVVSDCFYEDGAPFNKAKGVNKAIAALSSPEWICILDSDILVPSVFRPLNPTQEVLYGMERVDATTIQQVREWVGNQSDTNGFHKVRSWAGIGYFQLFHSNAIEKPYYTERFRDASASDTDFMKRFPSVVPLPNFCVHLFHGEHRANWKGRKTPLNWRGKTIDFPQYETTRKPKIVTFCARNMLDAHEFTIDSWRENGYESTVYTDCNYESPRKGVTFINSFPTPTVSTQTPLYRTKGQKVEIVDMFSKTLREGESFVFLDSDCYLTAAFDEVFKIMKAAQWDMVATRMPNRDRRGNGEANSGVIFFRNTKALRDCFVSDWRVRTEAYLNKGVNWPEQTAYSHLAKEAFDGLKPYSCGVVSERIYNCEHSDKGEWIKDIDLHKPKIIHFKELWYRDLKLVDRILGKVAEYQE